jgi:hypothetical protein
MEIRKLTWCNLCSSSINGNVSWQIHRFCSPLHHKEKLNVMDKQALSVGNHAKTVLGIL